MLPADIDERVLPPNRPPHIFVIDPDFTLDLAVQLTDLDCQRPTLFRVRLTDPDVGDTLYYRVFIDYATNTFDERRTTVLEWTASGEPPLPFPVHARDQRFDDQPDEQHLVELLVSDRPFLESVEGEQLPFRTPEPGGHTTSFVWPVYLPPGGCP